MEDKKIYDCNECANKATPLCNECNSITSPSGRMTRPTNYCHLIPLDRESRLHNNISAYLKAGKPIPLAMVIEYNEITEED
jgi:hypothetical protein